MIRDQLLGYYDFVVVRETPLPLALHPIPLKGRNNTKVSSFQTVLFESDRMKYNLGPDEKV